MNNLKEFIETELGNRHKDYLSSPTYILEHYNNERQNIEGYNGRQLLEMLQNADDASEKAVVKKVLIKLTNNELEIGNNGEPFSEDGFRSIFYINVSPKSMQKNKIGHKGLGFRSILSWSEEVTINSGGIRVCFSENIAKGFLENIFAESDEVSRFIKERSKEEYPIATLIVPKLLINEKHSTSDYDTTISIKLKDDIIDDVQTQINSIINKETLIFLNHIEIIEIDTPDKRIIYKKHFENSKKDKVIVECNDLVNNTQEIKDWNIKRKIGIHKDKDFELAIAWNNDLDDKENVLFSYFKTEVKFPFPALLHGTFELTSNRKRLENDTEGHNRFLTGELADLLVESSLVIGSQTEKANFLPLMLLNIDFNKIDSVLTDFNFKETLISKIKKSKVFPNVNGNYISYDQTPVYYDFPVADILSGNDVISLMPHAANNSIVSFLKELIINPYYPIDRFISIISERIGALTIADLATLIYHLITYPIYVENSKKYDFNLKKHGTFLVDVDNNAISWDSNIFLQPIGDKEFKLPQQVNISFVNPELISILLKKFPGLDTKALTNKLSVFKVKEYSFTEITQILVAHYNRKGGLLTTIDIRQLHAYLFRLYKRELKENGLLYSLYITTPVITITGEIKYAYDIYFGKYYGHDVTEKLYSFNKSKLLASQMDFRLESEEIELVKKYFKWLGVTDLPRYRSIELSANSDRYNEYKEHVLRNYDYKKANDQGEFYKDYNDLQKVLYGVPKITVGNFDDFKNILSTVKPITIFEWIKTDARLRKTIEDDKENLADAAVLLNIAKKSNYRKLNKSISSYTKWIFATTSWLPIEFMGRKVAPDKCCMSKTITNDFSPFVEKTNVNIPSISEKLELSETTIENYLIFLGVHRDISSFSIGTLYSLLSALPASDKTGHAARKIYREIISNFDQSKIDINHEAYIAFINSGKIYCQKGNGSGYFSVKEAYYLPTKTYGTNILKLFPIALIDGKQGPDKIEKLFGVKRLKDINFNIVGEPIINNLNDEFQNEIERFKALVYVLRMNKDTKHEIANRLKKLKIVLSQELQTNFMHNNESTPFELEPYEYIYYKKRNCFFISTPNSLTSIEQLRESNKFCQSIAEIFSSLIETEEFSGFIHDLYQKQEISREPRLLYHLLKEDDSDIIESKKQLNIIDEARLSFWRAFSFASAVSIRTEIRNEKELIDFLRKKLKFNVEKVEKYSSVQIFNELSELSIQKCFYDLFLEFDIDYKSFTRHFSGLNFNELFKNEFEDLKLAYRNDFACQTFEVLSFRPLPEKEKYFDRIDDYNYLRYDSEIGFVRNIEKTFADKVESEFSIKLNNKENNFSFEKKIKENIAKLKDRLILIPDLLIERRIFQAHLLFNEEGEIIKQISIYNTAKKNANTNPNIKQINVRGSTIEYDNYQSLAQKVLQCLFR